jgi:putative MATE family efflux protein
MAARDAVKLSDHVTYGRLLRFVGPSVVMMVFTSMYTIVDGLFVSNCAGVTAFAGLNLIYPFVAIMGTFGFMMGTGGSAIVAKTLGEGEPARASGYFSLFVWATVAAGAAFTAAGLALVRPVAELLGAQGELLEQAVLYGRICLAGITAFMLQNAFQSFFAAAGKTGLGLAVVVGAGVVNILLDAVFVGLLGAGIAGAAAATVLGQAVGGVVPLVYFARPNPTPLKLGRCRVDLRILGRACLNGSSELMTSVSTSVVGMLYNWQLMRMLGENGVAAYGVIAYVAFVCIGAFIGYTVGAAPLVSYNLGARNTSELRGLLRKSLVVTAVAGVAVTLCAETFAGLWARLFVGGDPELLELTSSALNLYALSFALCGFNIFGSAFFTALGNGPVSALISFLRTLVFECGSVLVLPLVLGPNGIWLAIVVAELAALVVTFSLLVGLRKSYGY